MSSPTADLQGPDLPGLAAEDIERRRRVLQRWRRHSTLIAILRRLLPALCLAIVVALGAWSAMSTFLWRQDKVRSNPNIRMLNFNFQGRTEAGKPYLLIAASAMKDNADQNMVTLDKPVLTIDVGGPQWTRITSVFGVYHEDTHMLDLRQHVTLDDYKGNHLDTEHALADTRKNNVDGDVPISGHGPLGSVAASSYSLQNGGAVVSFAGRVKTVIEQHAKPAAAPTPAGK
jgi:lipopolysaccharide export system protein LptC